MLKTVGILYGGKSGEHEVSLNSASSIVRNINRAKYRAALIGIDHEGIWYFQGYLSGSELSEVPPLLTIKKENRSIVSVIPGRGFYCGETKIMSDIVFPVLHGSFGEDGTMQGLLEMADLPYVGSNVLGSSVGMDKEFTKRVWRDQGLPLVPFLCVRKSEWEGTARVESKKEEILSQYDLPIFVKPCSLGSSVGITKVTKKTALAAAIDRALEYNTKAIVEPAIIAREIECSVIGTHTPIAFPPGEIIPAHDFYDYDAKYVDPEGARLCVPAEIPEEVSKRIQETACRAFTAVGASGLARIDFFYSEKTDAIYLNEINTLPGFTQISMFPKMCENGGLPYADIIEKIINFGFEEFHSRKKLRYRYLT